MFNPTFSERAEAGDLLGDLIMQGRKMMRAEDKMPLRIKELQDLQAARNLAAAQRVMDRMQWRPRASIALMTTFVCASCMGRTRLFSGFGVSMFRNVDGAERIVMTGCLDEAYPREVRETTTPTQACNACIQERGFDEKSHSTLSQVHWTFKAGNRSDAETGLC